MMYSDGIFDDPNLIDISFFALDSFMAVTTPFTGGGLKVGTYSLKIFIEKNLNKINDILIKTTSVKINIESTSWGLEKIIYENLDDKTFKERGKDFLINFGLSSLEFLFSQLYDEFSNSRGALNGISIL